MASASASALLAPITNAFDAVREGRITFVRPPAEADKLLVFKAGRIVESGPYDELVQHGGIFTALVRARGLANPADDTKV